MLTGCARCASCHLRDTSSVSRKGLCSSPRPVGSLHAILLLHSFRLLLRWQRQSCRMPERALLHAGLRCTNAVPRRNPQHSNRYRFCLRLYGLPTRALLRN